MHPIIASLFEIPGFANEDHSYWYYRFRERLAELRGEDASVFHRAVMDAGTRPSPFEAMVFGWAVADPTGDSYEIEARLNRMLRGLGARYWTRTIAWLALSPAEMMAAIEATVAALEPRADPRWLGDLRPVGCWLSGCVWGPDWKVDAWVGPLPSVPALPHHWFTARSLQAVAQYLVWAQGWISEFSCPEAEAVLHSDDQLEIENAHRRLRAAWDRHEAALGFHVLKPDCFLSASRLRCDPIRDAHPYCDR